MIIISGIQAGAAGGAARLLAHLKHQAHRHPATGIRFVFGKEGGPSVKSAMAAHQPVRLAVAAGGRMASDLRAAVHLRRSRTSREPVIIFHPQSLGMKRCRELIRRRREPTWLYLLDASFFCLRSYNTIPGEWTACTRCIGGNWKQAAKWQCRPFPEDSADCLPFMKALHAAVNRGTVRLLYQCRSQRRLALAHFGPAAAGDVVGMWADFDDPIRTMTAVAVPNNPPEIVFHGTPFYAKGLEWAFSLAAHCPECEFLFPFSPPSHGAHVPGNCRFEPMHWETGLKHRIAAASLVLVPSLWSAPIEGALVKSIIHGRMTAVVEQPTAFSSELPDSLVLKLPPDPLRAAEHVREALNAGVCLSDADRTHWQKQFEAANRPVLDRILNCVNP